MIQNFLYVFLNSSFHLSIHKLQVSLLLLNIFSQKKKSIILESMIHFNDGLK